MAELADGMSRDCLVSPVAGGFLAFCERAPPPLGDKNVRAARALAVTGQKGTGRHTWWWMAHTR